LPARWHGLAFTLAGSDTPDEVLAYLDEIVEKGVLSPKGTRPQRSVLPTVILGMTNLR